MAAFRKQVELINQLGRIYAGRKLPRVQFYEDLVRCYPHNLKQDFTLALLKDYSF